MSESIEQHGECEQQNGPLIIARPQSEWDSLENIADAAGRLVDAVTARMGAGEDASDEFVWEMFNAHRACYEALKARPGPWCVVVSESEPAVKDSLTTPAE
jgi:hypothetical protein